MSNPASNVIDLSAERFIVFCGSAGKSGIDPWVYTDEPFKMDRKAVVDLIASEAPRSLHSIIGFTVGGQCRDLTTEIMLEVATRWADNGEPLTRNQYELVELVLGMNVARAFRMEDAA